MLNYIYDISNVSDLKEKEDNTPNTHKKNIGCCFKFQQKSPMKLSYLSNMRQREREREREREVQQLSCQIND
jgi:hypothetical protein